MINEGTETLDRKNSQNAGEPSPANCSNSLALPLGKCLEHEALILIFLRWPQPGFVKTRLAAQIGADQACALYKSMAELVVRQALEAFGKETVAIMYTGADADCFAKWLGQDLAYMPQCDGDLGQRMQSAFSWAFQNGMKRCAAIGGDCPGVTPAILREAFSLLVHHDVVIGPALDGGYYLIGQQEGNKDLYDRINWGSSEVFKQTMVHCQRRGYSVKVLKTMRDVDTLQDAVAWNLIGQAINVIPQKNAGASCPTMEKNPKQMTG